MGLTGYSKDFSMFINYLTCVNNSTVGVKVEVGGNLVVDGTITAIDANFNTCEGEQFSGKNFRQHTQRPRATRPSRASRSHRATRPDRASRSHRATRPDRSEGRHRSHRPRRSGSHNQRKCTVSGKPATDREHSWRCLYHRRYRPHLDMGRNSMGGWRKNCRPNRSHRPTRPRRSHRPTRPSRSHRPSRANRLPRRRYRRIDGSAWGTSIDPATIPRTNAANTFTAAHSDNNVTAVGVVSGGTGIC